MDHSKFIVKAMNPE